MKRFLFVAVTVTVIIVFGIWLIVIPESLIMNLTENSLKDKNITLETKGFKKGLFYSFKFDGITLKKTGDTLLSLENVGGRINPLSLLLMRLTLSFDADTSGGDIKGQINLLKGKTLVNIYIDNANVDEMPLLKVIGLSGKGSLSGELHLRDKSGDLRFFIKDARFADKSFSGINVPLNVFHNVKGAMVINGDTVEVTSFSLEGSGIYARIKGNIRGGNIDLTMEIMPDSSFAGSSYIFSMIDNYKVSPGYYVIPIKSTISF